MAKTIRSLHGVEIDVTEDDLEMGCSYLGAVRMERPFTEYAYYAPETRKTYSISPANVEALGRIIYSIAWQTVEYLNANEQKVFADPDGEALLCDNGYAYSLWCATAHAKEIT